MCTFSPNSALLATGGDDDMAGIWDVSTLSLLRYHALLEAFHILKNLNLVTHHESSYFGSTLANTINCYPRTQGVAAYSKCLLLVSWSSRKLYYCNNYNTETYEGQYEH